MKHIISLSWPAQAIDDYEALVSVENLLLEQLPACCLVDGHDMGQGKATLYIITSNLDRTLSSITKIFGQIKFFKDIEITSRVLDLN